MLDSWWSLASSLRVFHGLDALLDLDIMGESILALRCNSQCTLIIRKWILKEFCRWHRVRCKDKVLNNTSGNKNFKTVFVPITCNCGVLTMKLGTLIYHDKSSSRKNYKFVNINKQPQTKTLLNGITCLLLVL